MSDSYILLLARLSKSVDPEFDLLQSLSAQLTEKFDHGETPVRCVLLLSVRTAIVWVRGISVSEHMVAKSFELGDGLTVDFEFPRNQPSYLVEISPKKRNIALDLKKFDRVYNELKESFRGASSLLLVSDYRIVVKFADPEEAVKQCASFVEPMKDESGAITIISRVVLIKEHVVMRSYFVGGSQPFYTYTAAHVAAHGGQTTTDYLHTKFSHFKDRPVALGMNGLPSGAMVAKQELDGQLCEEVNIACATNYDYRLLRNSPPVVLPNGAGTLILRVNLEHKLRKNAATAEEAPAPVAPARASGPPALAPPPNLPHPSTLAPAATLAAASAVPSAPVPTSAYIFWDYGSCPVDDEISSPEELDATTVATMTTNMRGVIDRYAQFKKDVGQPIKITGFAKNVFAPQGNSFKNIDKIPPTWGSFTKNEYKVHHYSKKCSAEQLVRSVLEGILKQHRRPNADALVLCFITNDPEFASIAAFLKLESQHDILLIHNSAQNTVTSLVKKHFSWTTVQDIPKNRREKKAATKGKEKGKDKAKEAPPALPYGKSRSFGELEPGEEMEEGEEYGGRELVPWAANGDDDQGLSTFGIEEDPELRKGGKKKAAEVSKALSDEASNDSDGDRPGQKSGGSEGNLMKLDLKFSSVATYIKRLMAWRKADEEVRGAASLNYLLGEDTSGYNEDPALACSLRVDINPKVKKFYLHIRGPSAALVEMRYQRIKHMVEECMRMRQLHNFSGWNAEHRNALIGSEVLAAQEKATRACVLFHYSGATTVAEIVALRQVQHTALLKFVQKLKPKETMIQIPAAFVCWYDEAIWEKMRSCFAIKADVIGADNKPIKAKTGYISPEDADAMVNLKIWGFMPKFMEKAIEHIHLNDEREEIKVVQWVDEASTAAAAAAMTAAANVNASKEKEKEKAGPAGRTVVLAAAPVVAPTASAVTAILREETKKLAVEKEPVLKEVAKGSKERLVEESAAAAHKTVYTFQDREGGRFFYEFDTMFREYLDKAFSVFVDEQEHAAQLALLSSGGDIKAEVLKVALYGVSLKNVQAARAYMEQFNTNLLGRHQIFYPRVSAKKYKEIFNKKTVQAHKMSLLRIKETAVDITAPKSSLAPVDPLKIPGFVNIRSRPVMRADSKVNFPTDVTITLCGSLASDVTSAVLDENKAAFSSIPSEFSIATVAVPGTHHMRAELTSKNDRDELVKKYNLVALRWEEGSRATGNVCTAKVWAYTKANLKAILSEILRTDKGGAAATMLGDDKDLLVADPPAHSPVPVPVPMPVPVPVQTTRFDPQQAVKPNVNGQTRSPITASQAGAIAANQAGNVKLFATAKGAIKPVLPPPPPVNHTKSVIYLPDLSLRFVMQGEPLKSKLNDVLERLLKNGAHIAYPYKDRADPHACFELEGESQCIARASVELNEFIEKATRSLRCVQVIMNIEQFNFFTGGGEGLLTGSNAAVQEMQTGCGVHFIFNPPPTSTREAYSLFDMRFATELVRKDEMDQLDMVELSLDPLEGQNKVDKEMLSVRVYNCFSQRNVEISIISSNSSETGWTWGVNNLLLLVGSNTLGFNTSETDQLNRGEVLVHNDRVTGKTILRIKPNALTRGVNYQAAVLTNALLKCLQKANELGLKGLAVSAPTDIDAFPELTPELIRSLTVEAVVEFAKKCRSYLRFTKLVCIELGNNVATQAALLDSAATPHIPAAMAALEKRIEPTQRDRMVRTMAVLLERQETEHLDTTLQNTYNKNPYGPPPPRPLPEHSRVSLLTCNVPLPLTLFTALPSYERPKGFKTFLVKGLLSSVVKAVDQIKAKLATPKPMDDLVFNVAEFF